MRDDNFKIEIPLESSLETTKDSQLIASFGILTDIQYADYENGHCFNKINTRYYRNSVNQVKSAINDWLNYQKQNGIKMKCLLQLGDIIDGKSRVGNKSVESLNIVLNELKKLFQNEDKLLHIWGNHEFYNFSRDQLAKTQLNTSRLLSKNQKNDQTNYYTYDITNKIRLICLDMYEMSLLGYDKSDSRYKEAELYVENALSCKKHYYQLNGTLSSQQFKWFNEQLKKCQKLGVKAIVCGHLPILTKSTDSEKFLAWNCHEIVSMIWSFDNTVIAYISGHNHQGELFKDKNNIYHITLRGVIEMDPDSNSYLTIEVFNDKVVVNFSEAKSAYSHNLI
jgi:manganese-dependent ADP-ribose/CDP-alcohol diphosphatase